MSLDADGEDDADLATAVGRYALGEVSLARAADVAGVDRWTFEAVLEEAGVPVRYGPETEADLDEEIETALDVDSSSAPVDL